MRDARALRSYPAADIAFTHAIVCAVLLSLQYGACAGRQSNREPSTVVALCADCKCTFVESTDADRRLLFRLQFKSRLARERISITVRDGMAWPRAWLKRFARADAASSGEGLNTPA
jgi:hypothetical protein